MNRNAELTKRRDRDIYALFKSLFYSGGYRTASQVMDTIVSSPAPRHYVDVRSAMRQFNVIRRGKPLSGSRRGMYYNLYREWLQLPRRDEISVETACERLLEQPAPSFYITVPMVKLIVSRERKREREALYEKAL